MLSLLIIKWKNYFRPSSWIWRYINGCLV